jgi:L-aminopeptidase/D-esterase-like protein
MAVRGGAPATRESDLLAPENTVQKIHAVMLSGGSAYGLDAAAGAMRWLEERKMGFFLAGQYVPIVCGASLFDLSIGDARARPDAEMGYAACETASDRVVCGNVGAGAGASVGKLLGTTFAMKTGLGAAGITIEGLTVSALVALNASGAVTDRASGTMLAGVRDPADPQRLLDPLLALLLDATSAPREAADAGAAADVGDATDAGAAAEQRTPRGADPEGAARGAGQVTNTTIACILTNAALSKPDMSRVASMAHDGFARALEPAHTSFDGDAIFALAAGQHSASADLVGVLAALLTEAAIHEAVLCAEGAFGLPAARDLVRTGTNLLDRELKTL